MLYNKCRTTRLRLQLYTSSLCVPLIYVMLCFRNSLSSFTSVSFVVGGIFRETIILTLSGNQKLSNDRHFQHKCGEDPAYWSQTSLKCILASSKGDWLNYFAVSNSRNFAISFTVQDSNRQPPSAAADSSEQKKLRYKAKQPICRLCMIFLPLLGTCSLVFRVVLRFMWM